MEDERSGRTRLVRLAQQIDQVSASIARGGNHRQELRELQTLKQLVAEFEMDGLEALELARILEALAFIDRVSDSLGNESGQE